MQDIRPANGRPIRSQPHIVVPAARRAPMQRPVGRAIDFVKPIKYMNFETVKAEPVVNVVPKINSPPIQIVDEYIPISEVVEKVQQIDEKPKKAFFHLSWQFLTRRNVLVGVVVVVLALVVAGYFSVNAQSTDKPLSNPPKAEATAQYLESEGSDETKLPKNVLTDYKVTADLPRALYIGKINIAARVLPMGVNIDGSMQAPVGIYDSGWYTNSSKPGEAGAMLVDGHASGPTREGLFANLDKLQNGDSIELEKGNGEKLSYKVVFTEIVPLDNVDMAKMLLPYGDSKQGLNLITCTGKWVKDKNTYDHRVTVYAARVE